MIYISQSHKGVKETEKHYLFASQFFFAILIAIGTQINKDFFLLCKCFDKERHKGNIFLKPICVNLCTELVEVSMANIFCRRQEKSFVALAALPAGRQVCGKHISFKYLRSNLHKVRKLFNRITNWEAWPFKVLYAPLSLVWGWYMLRSGSVWFFTPSNPKITFGGMDGETKKEMYQLLPKHLYPATFTVLPQQDFDTVKKDLQSSGIQYPFVVKPEVACQGILFRKIDNEAELQNYHAKLPVEYMVQALVHYPMEVSVFYIRHPQEKKGRVTGFLHKIPLQVTGNGKDTLEQLIRLHPKAQKRLGEMFSKHREHLQSIIPPGEKYMLSYAANHNRGAHFIDLKKHIDDKLVSIFDEISLGINDFFYGRYDIMCSNVEDLKNGKNFAILEYNGCGAEPNHFYDTGYTLLGAYKEILKHWKALYQICTYNSRQGIRPWPFQKGIKFLAVIKAHFKLIRKIDTEVS